jgi:hypothetical protein
LVSKSAWSSRAGKAGEPLLTNLLPLGCLPTPNQVKAARELLGWDRRYLANRIGATYSTVQNIELASDRSAEVNGARVRAALEAAGVDFTNGGNQRLE